MIDCGINRTSRAIESLANGPHETASGHRNRRWPPSRCYEWPPTVSQFAPDGRPDPGCGHAASIPASILLDGVGISLLSSSSASLTASSSSPLSAFCRRAERRCRWGRALWSGILWRVRITPPFSSLPPHPPPPPRSLPPLTTPSIKRVTVWRLEWMYWGFQKICVCICLVILSVCVVQLARAGLTEFKLLSVCLFLLLLLLFFFGGGGGGGAGGGGGVIACQNPTGSSDQHSN